MLALLGETPPTVSVVVDLLSGAVREWARAIAMRRSSPQPVSLQREFWREIARCGIGSGAILLGSWLLARGLGTTVGQSWSVDAQLVSGLANTRCGFVFVRRFWIDYRATMDHRTASEEALMAPGIGRAECWCWMIAITLSCATVWMTSGRPVLWLVSPLVSVQWIGMVTKSGLARRTKIQQLAIARHEACASRV